MRLLFRGWLALFACFTMAAGADYHDTKLPVEKRIDDLISKLSLPEKIDLLYGDGDFSTKGNARLGIPAIHMTDGPMGVRGGYGKQATAFPAAIAMAASFDPALTAKVSAAITNEANALGYDMLLAPCVNISRHPLGGRNFENFGEDPLLTTEVSLGYLRGIQSEGLIPSTKHLALNDQDFKRMTLNVIADERTMEEIYLPPFKAAVRAGTWSVMTAYNKINGEFGSENVRLLDILKNRWGFKGFVVSDWWATHSTVAPAMAGLDLEMPDGQNFGAPLLEAVQKEEVPVSTVDDKVRRILRAMFSTGLFDRKSRPPETVVGSTGHRKLAKQLADESMVLLKNDAKILPLHAAGLKTVAVIGGGGRHMRMGGKGSSMVNPTWVKSPLEVLREKQPSIKWQYAAGVRLRGDFDSIFSANWTVDANSAQHGVRAEYYASPDLSGNPALKRTDPNIDFDWAWNAPGAGLRQEKFSVRWTGFYHPDQTGDAVLALRSNNGAKLWLDGKLLIDAWQTHDERVDTVTVHFEAGHAYKIRMEYFQDGAKNPVAGLGLAEPAGHELEQAVALAKSSDAVVLFAGLSRFYEGEELDRESFDMPENQDQLIAEVVKANPNTIVILQGGNPVPMPWLAQVKGVIYAWYGGQEGSYSLADALLGRINPSGKLPVTFPKRWEDSSGYGNYPEDAGHPDQLTYSEGLYVGYRHFDRKGVEPLFPFGFGLSYTDFRLSGMTVKLIDRSVQHPKAEVTVQVTNSGAVAGAEVVQLYVSEKSPKADRPVRELKGFTKVSLRPGESKQVKLQLDESAFSYFDPAKHDWQINPGEFKIEAGNSSRNLTLSGKVTLN
jgi:beta-glucosidase